MTEFSVLFYLESITKQRFVAFTSIMPLCILKDLQEILDPHLI